MRNNGEVPQHWHNNGLTSSTTTWEIHHPKRIPRRLSSVHETLKKWFHHLDRSPPWDNEWLHIYPPQNAVTLKTFLIRAGPHALETIRTGLKSQMSNSKIQTDLDVEITNASQFQVYIFETLNGDHRRGKGGWWRSTFQTTFPAVATRWPGILIRMRESKSNTKRRRLLNDDIPQKPSQALETINPNPKSPRVFPKI